MDRADLAVGERARRQAGVAIIASMALATAFIALTWLSKETHSLYVRQPWQDDPYDVLVSLDFVILPLLLGIGVLRVQLCQRHAALPTRRVMDLLRLSGATLGVCLATELSEWIAVMLGLHRAIWDAATVYQMAALALATMSTVGVYTLLWRATHHVGLASCASSQPDWLADVVNLGFRMSHTLGRGAGLGQRAVTWIDTRAFARVRRHPSGAAALVAAVCALPYVAAKFALEGYPPLLLLLSFALPAASLFALVILVGRYLRIVAPAPSGPPAWLRATVAACLGGTLTFALHDSILSHQTPAGLNALLFGGAIAAGLLYITVNAAHRRLMG